MVNSCSCAKTRNLTLRGENIKPEYSGLFGTSERGEWMMQTKNIYITGAAPRNRKWGAEDSPPPTHSFYCGQS